MLEELFEANKYVISKIKESDPLILEMEKYAEEYNVPIITKEVAKYLEFLITSHKFKDILEVGTAIGYSGTIMARIAKKNDGTLTTIEIDKERYELALENFKKANLLDSVNPILGDATIELKKIDKTFDFVFIDASKGHYMEFFKDSFERLNKNGIIFIDNIMFRGYLYKEYPKRFKTIVKRLDEFINFLHENYNFVLLPFGDGIGLVYKD